MFHSALCRQLDLLLRFRTAFFFACVASSGFVADAVLFR